VVFSLHYCHNWVSSQALRDILPTLEFRETNAEEIVRLALAGKAPAVVSTYSEPLITPEWAGAVLRQARTAGLATGFVPNRNATPEALEYLLPWLDLSKFDLKTMDDSRHHQLGCRLKPVFDSIAAVPGMGFWLEVVTLSVPGNLDGLVGDIENTLGPGCRALVIERGGRVFQNRLTAEIGCPACGSRIPGLWRTGQVRRFADSESLRVRV
jgi:hypothetical protein